MRPSSEISEPEPSVDHGFGCLCLLLQPSAIQQCVRIQKPNSQLDTLDEARQRFGYHVSVVHTGRVRQDIGLASFRQVIHAISAWNCSIISQILIDSSAAKQSADSSSSCSKNPVSESTPSPVDIVTGRGSKAKVMASVGAGLVVSISNPTKGHGRFGAPLSERQSSGHIISPWTREGERPRASSFPMAEPIILSLYPILSHSVLSLCHIQPQEAQRVKGIAPLVLLLLH